VLSDGISRVEEIEEDIDPSIARACVAEPWRLTCKPHHPYLFTCFCFSLLELKILNTDLDLLGLRDPVLHRKTK
jgi:hypothetical protein